MKRLTNSVLAGITLVLLGGCTLGATWPVYAAVTNQLIAANLEIELATLTDEELAERLTIMTQTTPIVQQTAQMAADYQTAIATEIARRLPE